MKIDSAYVIGWSDGVSMHYSLATLILKKVKKLASTGANLVPVYYGLCHSKYGIWLPPFIRCLGQKKIKRL